MLIKIIEGRIEGGGELSTMVIFLENHAKAKLVIGKCALSKNHNKYSNKFGTWYIQAIKTLNFL